MAKNTMGTKLPRKLEHKMALMGEQIKLHFCDLVPIFAI